MLQFATADDCLGKKSHPQKKKMKKKTFLCAVDRPPNNNNTHNTDRLTDRMFVTCDTVFYCFFIRHEHAMPRTPPLRTARHACNAVAAAAAFVKCR